MATVEARSFVGRASALPDVDGNAHDVLHAMQKVMRKAARRVMQADIEQLARATDLAETHVREAIRDLLRASYISEMNPPEGWFVDRACECDYAGQKSNQPVGVANAGQEGVPSSHRRGDRQSLSLTRARAREAAAAETVSRTSALYAELVGGRVDGANRIERQRQKLLRFFNELAMDNSGLYEWRATTKVVRDELGPNLRQWIASGVPPKQIGDMMRRFWRDVEAGRIKVTTQPHRAFVSYRGEYGSATSTTPKKAKPWKPPT